MIPNAPIPGQSLTTPPGDAPWERPPVINDPEEAIRMHITRLNTEPRLKDIIDTLELGVTVVELTEGLLRSAVAEGIHSIDVSMIIAPVIHEFIKGTADEAGIQYEEGLVDTEAETKRDDAVTVAKTSQMLELDQTMPEPLPVADPPNHGPSMNRIEEPSGFMTRREV